MAAAAAALTSQERDALILRAYEIHGRNLGIASEERFPLMTSGRHYYFYVKGTPAMKCAATLHGKFYDFKNEVWYPSLDEFVTTVKEATPGLPDSPQLLWRYSITVPDPPPRHRRTYLDDLFPKPPPPYQEVPLERVVAELLTKPELREPQESDSWDVLLKKTPEATKYVAGEGAVSHDFFYRNPDTGRFIALTLWRRKSNRYRFVMESAPQTYSETLHALHPWITARDVFTLRANPDGKGSAWLPLSSETV